MPLMELHPYDEQIGQICYSRTRVRLTLKQDATGKEQQLDLYAWVKVGERDQRTGHAKGTLSPFWRQKFEWDGLRSKLTERPMVIEVCDSDPCDRTSRLLGSPAERPSLGGDDILPFATAYAAAAPPASPDALSMDARVAWQVRNNDPVYVREHGKAAVLGRAELSLREMLIDDPHEVRRSLAVLCPNVVESIPADCCEMARFESHFAQGWSNLAPRWTDLPRVLWSAASACHARALRNGRRT